MPFGFVSGRLNVARICIVAKFTDRYALRLALFACYQYVQDSFHIVGFMRLRARVCEEKLFGMPMCRGFDLVSNWKFDGSTTVLPFSS